MPTRLLRFVAPVLVFGAAIGAFYAASYALGATDADTVVYAVGIGFQFLAVGAMTAWLSAAEGLQGEGWVSSHFRQACLLYVITAGLMLLWPNAGHGSGVVQFLVFLSAAALIANATVLLWAARRQRRVAA